MVDVYIDGVQVANLRQRLRTMDETVIGRVEFVPATEAGARFGTGSGQDVLLIEIRAGGPSGLPEQVQLPPVDWRVPSELPAAGG